VIINIFKIKTFIVMLSINKVYHDNWFSNGFPKSAIIEITKFKKTSKNLKNSEIEN